MDPGRDEGWLTETMLERTEDEDWDGVGSRWFVSGF